MSKNQREPQMNKADNQKHSQPGRDLSGALWQLIDIEVKGDAALQAEEAAAAVAALLEDRLLCQIGSFAVEHQQVPVQKPGDAA